MVVCAEYAHRAVLQSTCVLSPVDGPMLSGSLVSMPGTLQLAILLFARLEELRLVQIVCDQLFVFPYHSVRFCCHLCVLYNKL